MADGAIWWLRAQSAARADILTGPPVAPIVVNEPSLATPHIRGSVIGPAKQWMIRTYGRPLFERALAGLPREEQSVLRGELVSVGWYPLAAWSRFLEAMRREVRAETGEDGATFDRRNVFESGSQTLTKVYRFVFGLFDPTTIVGKMTPVFRRIYSHGRVELLENVPGRCVLAFHSAPMMVLGELERFFPLSVELMLDLAGQRIVEQTPRLESDGETFSLTLEIRYRAE